MSQPFTLKVCSTCQGYGVLSQTQGTLTCTTCYGIGVWLETGEGKKLSYHIPEILTYHSYRDFQIRRKLKAGLRLLSFLVTIGSFLFIFLRDPGNLGGLVWGRGFSHALFGISGLTSIWALASWERHQTSLSSLHELETDLSQLTPPQTLNLKAYANPRVEQLIYQSTLTSQKYHSNFLDESVLLITLLQQPRIQVMLGRLELSAENLSQKISQFIEVKDAGAVQSVTITPSVHQRIYAGILEAINRDFTYIDLEDILLAFTEEPGTFTNVFKEFNLTYKQMLAVTRWYAEEQVRLRQWSFWLERGRSRPKGFMNRAWTALPTPFLDQFSHDITKMAGLGRVSSAKVREDEIIHILQILGQTQKNSVLLVGEPGVGKNTVLESLGLRMIEESVPEILKDKRLVSVDIGSLLSSQSSEADMQKVLDEVTRAGNVILAIPEVQSLVGTSGGGLDAAGLLSQALSRGYIQVITTATYADFHRYVESNSTLSSLLEVVEIKEASPEQTIEILEEETPRIESRQHVILTYPAIEASVILAKRYLPEKVLPDSALSLIDEASSQAQIKKSSWVVKRNIEEIVEKKTQIPVHEAAAKEADLLLNLEAKLHERIIGQDEAVTAIAEALRRARAGLSTGKKPIASFLFVGPTGVGKTESARVLAETYFSNQSAMIRLDMSEYQDGKAIYSLIGAPANDPQSYTEGGSLTQPIREHPFSLILLDEIEKAHPDVLNLFLQLLDDGRLTENTGRTVYFNNAIIVATSNAGSSEILQLLKAGISPLELPKQVIRILETVFKPEFINRFDAVIPFHALRPEEIEQITTLMLGEVSKVAASKGYTITFTPDLVTKIAQLGFDPLYGARPLRRVIQDKIEGLLAKKILEKSLLPNQSLQISANMIN